MRESLEISQRAFARAPANIALLKYMGKKNASGNIPTNPSISLTLDSLATVVEATWVKSEKTLSAIWLPELPRISLEKAGLMHELEAPPLTQSGIDRYLQHALKTVSFALESLPQFGFEVQESSFFSSAQLEIRSANTFPQASGIASSASSFAALTIAVATSCLKEKSRVKFLDIWKHDSDLKRHLAKFSRLGSGSSCRSFEGPFVFWEGEETKNIKSKLPPLADLVLILSNEPKAVSSSEAHARVKSSPLWNGRIERTQERARIILNSLIDSDFKTLSQIAWQESWEMHSLFHTSQVPFSYFTGDTIEALRFASGFLKEDLPPIVTVDAGANVHWIVQAASVPLWKARLSERFPDKKILLDYSGFGGSPMLQT